MPWLETLLPSIVLKTVLVREIQLDPSLVESLLALAVPLASITQSSIPDRPAPTLNPTVPLENKALSLQNSFLEPQLVDNESLVVLVLRQKSDEADRQTISEEGRTLETEIIDLKD